MALKGQIGPKRSIQVKSATLGRQSLSELTDVDISAREDGSVIIWDAFTKTWKAKSDVEESNLSIIGGSF